MKRASMLASAAVVALLAGAAAVPSHAQGTGGPFADVPVDHWAYKAVDTLQKDGIVIGYPDGTFGGKRAMTRYEFAVAIARLLEKLPQPDLSKYVTQDQLSAALAPYAKTSDLAIYAKQSDLDALKHLVDEFQTELTTLGVDLDATKKRLDLLEGRVTAIENEMKRVKISGDVNIYARGNNSVGSAGKQFIDADGFLVTREGTPVAGVASATASFPKNTLYDTSVLHDIDLEVKARVSDTATADVILDYGNYLPFVGSIASFSNTAGIQRSPDPVSGVYDQDEAFTVYKATIDTPVRIPYVGGIDLTVGRMPMQLTPYTLKLIDVDSYFYNSKTDLGDIPIDGGKVTLGVGKARLTAFAAKIDPISFVSDVNSQLASSTGDGGYGLYAGATQGPFGTGTNGFGSTTGVNYRPTGSLIAPSDTTATGGGNGAIRVDSLAGARLTASLDHFALGGTYMVAGGSGESAYPAPNGVDTVGNQNQYANRVFIYGGDLSGTLFKGIGVSGSYTKTDTGGQRLGTEPGTDIFDGSIDIGTHGDETKHNDAWEAALKYRFSIFGLTAGYEAIGPYFAAPGYWDKIGSWTNPVDVKGPYGKINIPITHALALDVEGKFFTGTGEAIGNGQIGGLTTDDRITNYKAGFKYALTSPSSLGLGIESTQYKIGEGPNTGDTPTEYLVDVGYGYSFTPLASFKLGYQFVNYLDKNTGLDPNGSSRGGVAFTQFSTKF